MSAPEREEALRWLQFALDDFAAAKALLSDAHLPARLDCFHCQQSAEKALKALLIFRSVPFPKTHDLNLLLRVLPLDLKPKIFGLDLSTLNVFAAEARYPGDFPDATTNEASNAVLLSEQILKIVKAACGF
jgi:HEPN domain-containing protein